MPLAGAIPETVKVWARGGCSGSRTQRSTTQARVGDGVPTCGSVWRRRTSAPERLGGGVEDASSKPGDTSPGKALEVGGGLGKVGEDSLTKVEMAGMWWAVNNGGLRLGLEFAGAGWGLSVGQTPLFTGGDVCQVGGSLVWVGCTGVGWVGHLWTCRIGGLGLGSMRDLGAGVGLELWGAAGGISLVCGLPPHLLHWACGAARGGPESGHAARLLLEAGPSQAAEEPALVGCGVDEPRGALDAGEGSPGDSARPRRCSQRLANRDATPALAKAITRKARLQEGGGRGREGRSRLVPKKVQQTGRKCGVHLNEREANSFSEFASSGC